jgi:hypothetical protein
VNKKRRNTWKLRGSRVTRNGGSWIPACVQKCIQLCEYITQKLRFSTTRGRGERKINKRNTKAGAGNKGLKYDREREGQRKKI